MLTHLFDQPLKSGQTMEVIRVQAPQPDMTEAIAQLLLHKGEPWLWQLRLALNEGLPGIDNCYYLGRVGEELVGNIMLVESLPRPVGILGHVFTPEKWRRNGICSALMRACTQDFVARGGRALHLGTGHESPAYWIYHSFGFRSILNTGAMRWLADETFDETFFARGKTTVRETQWSDWPPLDALYKNPVGWFLRSFACGQWIVAGFEGGYLSVRKRMEHGDIQQVRVLESEHGAIVGIATLATQPAWHGDPLLLDFYVHPNFTDRAPDLVRGLDLPGARKVQCYAESSAEAKIEALHDLGFACEATLQRQVQFQGESLDIHCYCNQWSG
jgi:hypothetical protein